MVLQCRGFRVYGLVFRTNPKICVSDAEDRQPEAYDVLFTLFENNPSDTHLKIFYPLEVEKLERLRSLLFSQPAGSVKHEAHWCARASSATVPTGSDWTAQDSAVLSSCCFSKNSTKAFLFPQVTHHAAGFIGIMLRTAAKR